MLLGVFTAILATVMWVTGCRPPNVEPNVYRTDSLVLERSSCFGRCPAYRVRVAKDGTVLFTPSGGQTSAGRVSNQEFVGLLHDIEIGAFFYLPARIEDDKHFCPGIATDFSTATVTWYWPGGSKRVEDYHGCMWAPVTLRALEQDIDSAAGSARFIRATLKPQD